MWFRVEQNKDGSVASAEYVEASSKNSRYVTYVEADSKESAIALVVNKYQRQLERLRTNAIQRYRSRLAAGLCRESGCDSPPVDGQTRCKKHRAKGREVDRARGRLRGKPRPPIEERALRAAHLAKERNQREQASSLATFGMSRTLLSMQRKYFREALAAYDENPRGIRAWLVAKLKSLGVDADEKSEREPFAFEAAAE